ncbi:TPA: hypothetical protein ACSRGA_002196 [Klebsiella variicola subsp. variicola]
MTTDITELAQKPTRYGTNSQGVFTNQTDGAYVSYLDFVALVEALEKAQQRIAELESRAVKLPKKNIGWDRDEEDCWNNAIDACAEVLAAAGIKVEAE